MILKNYLALSTSTNPTSRILYHIFQMSSLIIALGMLMYNSRYTVSCC